MGALRSADAVAALAGAKLQRAAEAATRGWVLIPGAPQVEPGDNVDLAGLPSGADGLYRVEEIVHELDVRRGYRSRLRVVRAGAGRGGGGLGDLIGGLL